MNNCTYLCIHIVIFAIFVFIHIAYSSYIRSMVVFKKYAKFISCVFLHNLFPLMIVPLMKTLEIVNVCHESASRVNILLGDFY